MSSRAVWLMGCLVFAATFAAISGRAWAAVEYKILTGAESGTYYAIGRDLAKLVAPSADIKLQVVSTGGSVANASLLASEPGAKLAIIQAGVMQALVNDANSPNAKAHKSLRVVLPLFATELHYLVRADSEMNYLHDIKNAKINLGDGGGGAGPATEAIYRMMFGGAIPKNNMSEDSNEAALIKLVIDKTTDVVVVASGQLCFHLDAEFRPSGFHLGFQAGAFGGGQGRCRHGVPVGGRASALSHHRIAVGSVNASKRSVR